MLYTSRELQRLFEFTSAEFFNKFDYEQDPQNLMVRYNGKEMSIKTLLQIAKTDSEVAAMLSDLKKVQKEEGLDSIPFLEFLAQYLGNDDDLLDYSSKEGVTRYDPNGVPYHAKPDYKVDTKEIEKNKSKFKKFNLSKSKDYARKEDELLPKTR
jgi:hypothetical protein